MGRKKRMFVRYDGYKIYPENIERVILEYSSVKNCVVIPCNIPNLGIMPVAYICMNLGENVDKESLINQLLESCKQKLAERMIPSEIIVLDDIPITNLGKIDYKKLENTKEIKQKCKTNNQP